MIPKEKESEIVRLYHGEKWPIGTIAAQLGLHHTTVQRVLRHTGVEATLVDRLIHRAEVIEIEADSYRLKEAKELSAARTKHRRGKKA